MQRCAAESQRSLRDEQLGADLVVVGGGMAGVCASITAARAGAKVILVQDRPVLGGNASSEVRLWMVGATSHMGNNNRWAREGGVFDEICVENTHRNPEGNPVIFDTILLEKVFEEPNLHVLLNTAVFDLEMAPCGKQIESIRAFCSQTSTQFLISAPLYCDSSGDGIIAFMAGAPFRYGAESQQEFGELLAPADEHTNLLGHSLFFYTRDTNRPVRFVAPSYALEDITSIPRYRRFNAKDYGCQLWWIEFGGSLDTIHDTESIKLELWKVVYGVWNYIKNSGEFPESETMALDWVGTIPGKRESRRFEGDYMLIQQDIVEQRLHYDAVSVGGWAIDEHPADNVYSDKSPCIQWHSKGVYQIPYRTMFSRSVNNLFLTGRVISASHIAFCSSRVMATCAQNGQAVGMAAAICSQHGYSPRDLADPQCIGLLQQSLLRSGQYIPGYHLNDPNDLAKSAVLTASSQLRLGTLPSGCGTVDLCDSRAMLVPLNSGKVPSFEFEVHAETDTILEVQLRVCSRVGSFTPDTILKTLRIPIEAQTSSVTPESSDRITTNGDALLHSSVLADNGGRVAIKAKKVAASTSGDSQSKAQALSVDFQTTLSDAQYAFVCIMENPGVSLALSDKRVTGILALSRRHNHRVANGAMQKAPDCSGIDSFDFWTPERRPKGQNLAMRVSPELEDFGPSQAVNGICRPTTRTNAWIASFEDPSPTLKLQWDSVQSIERIELVFDTDLDHPMESVVMQHFETESPFCVRDYRITAFNDQEVFRAEENYQTRNTIQFDTPLLTDVLKIELVAPSANVPASLFEVRCYEPS